MQRFQVSLFLAVTLAVVLSACVGGTKAGKSRPEQVTKQYLQAILHGDLALAETFLGGDELSAFQRRRAALAGSRVPVPSGYQSASVEVTILRAKPASVLVRHRIEKDGRVLENDLGTGFVLELTDGRWLITRSLNDLVN